jgi:hypothetical protein
MINNIFVLALLLSASLQADVLFTDSFDGPAVDPNKWNTVLPYGDSAVSQASGSLHLERQGGVFTAAAYSQPFELTGTFINHNVYSLLTVVLRSDESIANNNYKTANGIHVMFWGPLGFSEGGRIDIRVEDPLIPNWGTNLAVNPEDQHSFRIVDTGSSVRVEFNGSLILDYQTTFSLGGKVGFFSRDSRDNFGPGPSRWEGDTEILSAQISSVPEPSSLSLIVLGLSGMAVLRRRWVG